jgi:hypothetical protein
VQTCEHLESSKAAEEEVRKAVAEPESSSEEEMKSIISAEVQEFADLTSIPEPSERLPLAVSASHVRGTFTSDTLWLSATLYAPLHTCA